MVDEIAASIRRTKELLQRQAEAWQPCCTSSSQMHEQQIVSEKEEGSSYFRRFFFLTTRAILPMTSNEPC